MTISFFKFQPPGEGKTVYIPISAIESISVVYEHQQERKVVLGYRGKDYKLEALKDTEFETPALERIIRAHLVEVLC